MRIAHLLLAPEALLAGAVLPDPRLRRVRVPGSSAHAHAVERKLARHGVHEPVLTAWLLENLRLRAGEVALDVGANIGWYSVLLDRLAEPGVSIFCFEPDPENGELLRRNVERNAARRVHAVAAALRGAARVLTRCGMLLMEYSPRLLRAAALDIEEPLALPLAAGLRPHVFDGDGLRAVGVEELMAIEGQANLLWLR